MTRDVATLKTTWELLWSPEYADLIYDTEVAPTTFDQETFSSKK